MMYDEYESEDDFVILLLMDNPEEEEEEEEYNPHMMYDPRTGKSKFAKTEKQHLKLQEKGWKHSDEMPQSKCSCPKEDEGEKLSYEKPPGKGKLTQTSSYSMPNMDARVQQIIEQLLG